MTYSENWPPTGDVLANGPVPTYWRQVYVPAGVFYVTSDCLERTDGARYRVILPEPMDPIIVEYWNIRIIGHTQTWQWLAARHDAGLPYEEYDIVGQFDPDNDECMCDSCYCDICVDRINYCTCCRHGSDVCCPNCCDGYCGLCAFDTDEEDDAGILNYSYRPTFGFHYVDKWGSGNVQYAPTAIPPDDGTFMGFELEIETHDRREAAEMVREALSPLVYLKEDATIDYGFEMVTHPMTYAYFRSVDWSVLRDLRRAGGRTTNGNGLHVHVTRETFADPCHVYRWLKFIYRNADPIMAVARRVSSWGAFDHDERLSAKAYAKPGLYGHGAGMRSVAVNTTNRDTFEVRCFRSTLNPVKLSAAIGLVHGSVEYTRNITAADIIQRDAWSYAQFIAWAESHGNIYADLITETYRRNALQGVIVGQSYSVDDDDTSTE